MATTRLRRVHPARRSFTAARSSSASVLPRSPSGQEVRRAATGASRSSGAHRPARDGASEHRAQVTIATRSCPPASVEQRARAAPAPTRTSYCARRPAAAAIDLTGEPSPGGARGPGDARSQRLHDPPRHRLGREAVDRRREVRAAVERAAGARAARPSAPRAAGRRAPADAARRLRAETSRNTTRPVARSRAALAGSQNAPPPRSATTPAGSAATARRSSARNAGSPSSAKIAGMGFPAARAISVVEPDDAPAEEPAQVAGDRRLPRAHHPRERERLSGSERHTPPPPARRPRSRRRRTSRGARSRAPTRPPPRPTIAAAGTAQTSLRS